jgi:hypothetical protein
METKREYTVEGRWPFPLDMLRSDESVPATPEDKALIDRISLDFLTPGDTVSSCYTVRLVQSKRRRGANVERWASFGWKVIDAPVMIGHVATTDAVKALRDLVAQVDAGTSSDYRALQEHQVMRLARSAATTAHTYDELLQQRNELLGALQRFMRLGTMNDQGAIEAARSAIDRATGGA